MSYVLSFISGFEKPNQASTEQSIANDTLGLLLKNVALVI